MSKLRTMSLVLVIRGWSDVSFLALNIELKVAAIEELNGAPNGSSSDREKAKE